jgi:hypothetical protein
VKYWTKILPIWPVLALGATLAAEAAWLRAEYQKAGLLTLRWQQQLSRAEQAAGQAPAPTPENEQAMAADVARLQRSIAAKRAELWPRAAGVGEETSIREAVDAYFDLAAMMTRLRAAADAANVVVKRDEYFGFEAYAREGPADANRKAVRQQSVMVETILACLFQARPERLVGVKRERVEPAFVAGDRQAKDFLVVPPSLSLRRTGTIDTLAFRIEFRGETAVLRRFLGALADRPEMLVVRSIEVSPPGGSRSGNAAPRGEAPGLLVRQHESHFAVIVEAVKPPSVPPPTPP